MNDLKTAILHLPVFELLVRPAVSADGRRVPGRRRTGCLQRSSPLETPGGAGPRAQEEAGSLSERMLAHSSLRSLESGPRILAIVMTPD